MEAKKNALNSFLTQQLILNVPIYQRKYNWSFDECKQLFSDILNIGKDDSKKGYFIGSIVYKKEESSLSPGSGPQEYILIDGQQRVTTLTLIYCALCEYYNETQPELSDYYHRNFLLNNDIKKSNKLNLTTEDDITLKRIIKSLTSDKELKRKDDDALNLFSNYELFKNLITDENIEDFTRGIEKLLFIEVGLDNDDNPQLIFESLNSTGLELKKNDLIRNFILMGLDSQHQNELYEEYWHEIELGFKNNDNLFDDFIRYYLAVKKGKLPKQDNIYKDFKILSRDFDSIDDLVKEVYKFANYFFNIHFEQEPDENLLNAFKSLNKLEFDVTLPFLLSVYEDYENAKNNPEINLTKDEFVEIVKYVESYCLRRSICDIPTNSMNYTFARLSKEIDKTDYFNYFIAVMAEKDSYRRFPTDLEVEENILIKNMYSKRRTLNHILINIENYEKKQIVLMENCTIEHIMPQHLTDNWKKELGDNYEEIHEKYLHTLGNLTLTPYNSEMGDKSFHEKQTMAEIGFKDSKLNLNKKIADLDIWNEEEIVKRSKELAHEINKIWKYPGQSDEITEIIETIDEIDDASQYTLDDFKNLDERSFTRQLFDTISFMILNIDSSIKQNIWKTYVAYNYNDKNFVEIKPLQGGLKIILDIPLNQLNDSERICEDVSEKSAGTGDSGLYLRNEKDVNYVMDLVRQSYEYNLNPKNRQEEVEPIDLDFNYAYEELEKLAGRLDVMDNLKVETEKIYSDAAECGLLRGRTKETLIASSLYVACRVVHAPFNKQEISSICGIKSKSIMKVSKNICTELNIDLPLIRPNDYVSRYCKMLDLSKEVEDKANELCDEAESAGIVMGKNPTVVVASVLYVSSVLMDEKRTQKDISKLVNVSEVAIRNYTKLLKEELNISI